MPLTPDDLRSIPLLANLTDAQLSELSGIFERLQVQPGDKLCSQGDPAGEFYILATGEVSLADGDRVHYELSPPSPIGELGALGGLVRNVTVTATKGGTIWRASSSILFEFLRGNPAIGLVFYQNLIEIVAEKVRRDQLRMADMRANLISTQKEMKALRDYVLESEETPLSARVHDSLEKLIDHNRRINYRVAPPKQLPATVRVDKAASPMIELSRTHFTFRGDGAVDDRITAVIALAGPELPISGRIMRNLDGRITIELDPLIDEYAALLEGYLSRVQMLDFVV